MTNFLYHSSKTIYHGKASKINYRPSKTPTNPVDASKNMFSDPLTDQKAPTTTKLSHRPYSRFHPPPAPQSATAEVKHRVRHRFQKNLRPLPASRSVSWVCAGVAPRSSASSSSGDDDDGGLITATTTSTTSPPAAPTPPPWRPS